MIFPIVLAQKANQNIGKVDKNTTFPIVSAQKVNQNIGKVGKNMIFPIVSAQKANQNIGKVGKNTIFPIVLAFCNYLCYVSHRHYIVYMLICHSTHVLSFPDFMKQAWSGESLMELMQED